MSAPVEAVAAGAAHRELQPAQVPEPLPGGGHPAAGQQQDERDGARHRLRTKSI